MAAIPVPAMRAASASPPFIEGKDTPKICLEAGAGSLAAGTIDEAGLRKIKQLGVDHVLTGGPKIPWEESRLQEMMDKIKAAGLSLGNLMISGFPNAIYGRSGRDEDIEKVIQSIRAAGKVGCR